MMDRHLKSEAHWEAWLALLDRFPGQEEELDTRAALLCETFASEGAHDSVFRALTATADVAGRLAERDAARGEEVPDRVTAGPWRSRWIGMAVGVGALAAALLLVVQLRAGFREDPAGWRGTGTDLGVVSAWSDGPRVRLDPGVGVRRGLSASGEVHARWEGGDGPMYAWFVDDGGIRFVGEAGFLDGPRSVVGVRFAPVRDGTLVLGRLDGDADVAALAARVGDGRAAIEGELPAVHLAFVAVHRVGE